MTRMKTTIDVDEDKLIRVMNLTGIRTRKEAVDFALGEVERLARIRLLIERSLFAEPSGDVVDPGYDLLKLREAEKPR